ncbi:MAG: tyrosine-type recombinase/integrase [Candidatus Saccharimonadales bacterium]
MSLTDVTIRNAKPKAAMYRLYDARGLYLEVTPKGGKWWRFKYRFAGKEKRLSLGVYPEINLNKARDLCDDARRMLRNGTDPSTHRKQTKAARIERHANTFEVVARAWFEARSSNWAPSHADKVIRRLERDVFPIIGGRPIIEITGPELNATMQRIAERGAVETSRRALGNIGQIFRYAIATGIAKTDLSKALWDGMPKKPGTHLAAPTTPERVGSLLRMIWNYEGSPVVAAALKFGPLVFVRPGELRMARWSDIDLDAAEWRFTTSKTRTEHIVPLSTQAVDVLRALHPLTGNDEFVFPSAHSTRRPMSDMAVNAALRRLGVDKTELTGHGWRATARTMLDEQLGFRPDYIEHQLAHAVKDPNGRAYNRTAFLPERRKMMQAWADYLDGLREGANIVSLPARRAK